MSIYPNRFHSAAQSCCHHSALLLLLEKEKKKKKTQTRSTVTRRIRMVYEIGFGTRRRIRIGIGWLAQAVLGFVGGPLIGRVGTWRYTTKHNHLMLLEVAYIRSDLSSSLWLTCAQQLWSLGRKTGGFSFTCLHSVSLMWIIDFVRFWFLIRNCWY